MNNTTSDAEDAARRAAEAAAFLASFTVGGSSQQMATPMCICGKNPVHVVHATKGSCCTECAKD